MTLIVQVLKSALAAATTVFVLFVSALLAGAAMIFFATNVPLHLLLRAFGFSGLVHARINDKTGLVVNRFVVPWWLVVAEIAIVILLVSAF